MPRRSGDARARRPACAGSARRLRRAPAASASAARRLAAPVRARPRRRAARPAPPCSTPHSGARCAPRHGGRAPRRGGAAPRTGGRAPGRATGGSRRREEAGGNSLDARGGRHGADDHGPGGDHGSGPDLDAVHDDSAHPEYGAVTDAGVPADVRARVDDRAVAQAGVMADKRAARDKCLLPELRCGADHGGGCHETPFGKPRGRAHVPCGVDDRRRTPTMLGEERPECEPITAEPEDGRAGPALGAYDGQAVPLPADAARVDQLEQAVDLAPGCAYVLDHLERERTSPRDVDPGHWPDDTGLAAPLLGERAVELAAAEEESALDLAVRYLVEVLPQPARRNAQVLRG